jgi:hypothetical protein
MSDYTPEQQAANRKVWVAALRSGEYRQTTGTLRALTGPDEFRFCCLGVACDVAAKAGVGEWDENSDEFIVIAGDTRYAEEGELPAPVRDWLGLYDNSGSYQYGAEYDTTSLITNNDSDGWDFEAIAKLIESEPDGLIA